MKRYILSATQRNGTVYTNMEEQSKGPWMLFTDHESDKAAALAAKDAEIEELKHDIEHALMAATAEARFADEYKAKCQAIAEQVRQRIINEVKSAELDIYYKSIAMGIIRGANLLDKEQA